MECDAAKPGIKLAITPELIQRAHGGQERFLDQIFGYSLVLVHLGQYQSVEPAPVNIIEFLHGRAVARAQLLDQLRFITLRGRISYFHDIP